MCDTLGEHRLLCLRRFLQQSISPHYLSLKTSLQFGNGTKLKSRKGIGRFGIGLPNASISQCRHVEVYSWQNSKCLQTYLDIDEKINSLIRDFEKSDQVAKETYEQSSVIIKQKDISINTLGNSQIEQENAQQLRGLYSLQTGAFSVRANAELQKIDLTMVGFQGRITELYRNNRVLYAVRIGHYNSKSDARKIGSQIKIKLNLDTIVVTNN